MPLLGGGLWIKGEHQSKALKPLFITDTKNKHKQTHNTHIINIKFYVGMMDRMNTDPTHLQAAVNT